MNKTASSQPLDVCTTEGWVQAALFVQALIKAGPNLTRANLLTAAKAIRNFNADGMIASPNVDLVGEGITQIAATQVYKANLRVIQVAQELERETAEMLGRNRHDITA